MITHLLRGKFLLAFILLSVVAVAQPDQKQLNKLLKKANESYSYSRYTEAGQYFQQVLDLDPNHFLSAQRMGEISYKLQDYRGALDWYRRAIEINPEQNDTLYLLSGLIHKKLNNYQKAKENFLTFQRKHANQEDEYAQRAITEIRGCDYAESMAGKLPKYRVDTLPVVNSEANDLYPSFLDQRQEDKYLVFTSFRANAQDTGKKKKKKDKVETTLGEAAFSDLWSAIIENDTTFSTVKNLGQPLNTLANDGNTSFSIDGLTVYYARANQGKTKGGYECSIYESRYDYTKKQWGKPELVEGINGTTLQVVNSKGKTKKVPTYDIDPYISSDGSTMYFVSDREGGKGGLDIWISHRQGTGWGAPINAGDEINTPFNEKTPFLSLDGTKLYFASEGHVGFGGYDLYVSNVEGPDVFGKAENFGAPLNSSYDEIGSMWPTDTFVYYSSNRPGGKGRYDLYRANWIHYATPTLELALQGKAINKATKQPIPYATVILYEVNGDNLIPVDTFRTNQTGEYNFPIEPNKQYKVLVNADKYLSNATMISTMGMTPDPEKPGLQIVKLERELTLEAKPIIISDQIVLQNVYYDYDKYYIRDDAAKELDKLVKILKDNPKITIQLGSHTDTNGSEPYNKALSENRAMAAVKYVVDRGIDPARLSWFGYGESMPYYTPELNDEQEQANRRTEFKITSFGKKKAEGEAPTPAKAVEEPKK